MILPLVEMTDGDAKSVRQTSANSNREQTETMTKTPSEEEGGGRMKNRICG